jgi:hypothetical protein
MVIALAIAGKKADYKGWQAGRLTCRQVTTGRQAGRQVSRQIARQITQAAVQIGDMTGRQRLRDALYRYIVTSSNGWLLRRARILYIANLSSYAENRKDKKRTLASHNNAKIGKIEAGAGVGGYAGAEALYICVIAIQGYNRPMLASTGVVDQDPAGYTASSYVIRSTC